MWHQGRENSPFILLVFLSGTFLKRCSIFPAKRRFARAKSRRLRDPTDTPQRAAFLAVLRENTRKIRDRGVPLEQLACSILS